MGLRCRLPYDHSLVWSNIQKKVKEQVIEVKPSNFNRYYPYKRFVFNSLQYLVMKNTGTFGQQFVHGPGVIIVDMNYTVLSRTFGDLQEGKGLNDFKVKWSY